MEWIKMVFESPAYEQTQPDGRKKKWGFVKEAGKYLRIVVLEDGETIHNAFFDRNFKI